MSVTIDSSILVFYIVNYFIYFLIVLYIILFFCIVFVYFLTLVFSCLSWYTINHDKKYKFKNTNLKIQILKIEKIGG